MAETARNVLGGNLQVCSRDPLTGFYRDGCCATGPDDLGSHTVCAQMTPEFLAYSREHGNDLITPMPQYRFPGLKPGDRWCVCAGRWLEAYHGGAAPPVYLAATHEKALEMVPFTALAQHAVDKLSDQTSAAAAEE